MMAEYIEREALEAELNKIATEYVLDKSIQCTLAAGVVLDIRDEVIRQQPTADVVEVRHGEWYQTEAMPHWVFCSECYKRFVPNSEWLACYDIPTNYCPNCGAKMDGKGDAE